jgi:hypothetical protein
VVGAGLGVDGEGIMNPLVAKTKNDKAGLGKAKAFLTYYTTD